MSGSALTKTQPLKTYEGVGNYHLVGKETAPNENAIGILFTAPRWWTCEFHHPELHGVPWLNSPNKKTHTNAKSSHDLSKNSVVSQGNNLKIPPTWSIRSVIRPMGSMIRSSRSRSPNNRTCPLSKMPQMSPAQGFLLLGHCHCSMWSGLFDNHTYFVNAITSNVFCLISWLVKAALRETNSYGGGRLTSPWLYSWKIDSTSSPKSQPPVSHKDKSIGSKLNLENPLRQKIVGKTINY